MHLVETSPHLREKQRAALGALPKEPAASAPAASAEAKEGKAEASVGANKGGSAAEEEEEDAPVPMRLPGGCGDVHWHHHFGEVGAAAAGGASE